MDPCASCRGVIEGHSRPLSPSSDPNSAEPRNPDFQPPNCCPPSHMRVCLRTGKVKPGRTRGWGREGLTRTRGLGKRGLASNGDQLRTEELPGVWVR